MQPFDFYHAKLKEYSFLKRNQLGEVGFSLGNELQSSMQIEAKTLFASDFFTINDLICHCCERCTESEKDSNTYFNITFTRNGYFTFNTFRGSIDAHNSHIFIKKPDCEYSVTQMTDHSFGCTIINFSENFLHELERKVQLKNIDFFRNKDMHVLMLKSKPELELLHFLVCRHLGEPEISKLYLDCMIIEMVEIIVDMLILNNSIYSISSLNTRHQIQSVQMAKEYMSQHYCKCISLHELSRYSCVSPFHFTRIFKRCTGYSPYHYLQLLRLKNAEILLKTTNLTIADIGFKSGFNSPDYFCAAFTKSYKVSPSRYKDVLV
ncbi:MAG: helix-turn-helix transcriptional regulator [Chitinophagaceae bacterium]|nr:helix-turn-helix transcriptional regulator [Chitinophagaceae bacterium]